MRYSLAFNSLRPSPFSGLYTFAVTYKKPGLELVGYNF